MKYCSGKIHTLDQIDFQLKERMTCRDGVVHIDIEPGVDTSEVRIDHENLYNSKSLNFTFKVILHILCIFLGKRLVAEKSQSL